MIAFVILHYIAEEETKKCVEYIKKISGDKKVIIVDNASSNGTGKKLKNIYSCDSMVDVLLNAENLGFARGNNVGCRFAKDNYDPDFYVVLNNDVEIHQKEFIEIVQSVYEREKFDILGPDVYCDTLRIHQSPKSLKRTSIQSSSELKVIYEKRVRSKLIVPLRCALKSILFLRNINNKRKEQGKKINYRQTYSDVPLHGSCFIFSKKFIDGREVAFFPDTFFYYESEVLDYEAQIYGNIVLYDPSLQVIHHHNVSTDMMYKNEIQKVRFMNKQNLASINAFLKTYGK